MRASTVSRRLVTLLAVLSIAVLVAGPAGAREPDQRHHAAERGGHDHEQGRGQRGERRSAEQRPRQAEPQRAAHPGAQGYAFRAQDRERLQRHYRRALDRTDRHHRPSFVAGQPIHKSYRGYITPAPAGVVHHLPPLPHGHAVGYYRGYTVVYDPVSFIILGIIDLLDDRR
ncbi:hypothetical protein [Pseudothauera rhizosphaerae]|uniref:Nickel/cobalt transporter regulator n=1 Tax=Pseudothauera rhizosphaerae TaxID=2565932 RepID=A0A4S4AYI5_9RHOO|nr:hypothetical protein [Pseudothauera rhizosphaerae]THF65197.1 hypothetical protein E6O51_00935 [Pseudothauera rhizosphaerae]